GIAELHADAGGAIALRTGRSDPDDLAGDRQAVLVLEQRQQQDHFVAERITLGGGDEDAAAFHVRDVGAVQLRLVLDGERENALPCACAGNHPVPPCRPLAGLIETWIATDATTRPGSGRAAAARAAGRASD